MLVAIVVILIILWLLGYAPISGISVPDFVLFSINNHPITLWNILILAVISWAIGILPRPLQVIASILLILWILSVLGIFALVGSNILVLIIIIAFIVSIFL
ncbi:MAG: hypothetical protein AAB662_04200 [Patescibacteria group bacterium]